MSTYLKSDNTYDNEAKEFFDYEQQRLKLFTEKINLSNKFANINCRLCLTKYGEHSSILAAKNGHLDCLKYAHENGYKWDNIVCSEAAKNGHLDCLKYAHEKSYFFFKI